MAGRRVVARAAGLGVALALALGSAPPAAVAAKPSPTPPFPIPSATSTVGGPELSSDRVLTDLAPGTPAPPQPKAVGWLVADLDSRQILAGRRMHVPLPTASTMKIFTALALAPRLDPKDVYTAVPADANIDGTKVGLVPGSRYTVDMLLHGLLMASGNDCANALGNLAGGQAKAVELMAAEAESLGALDTVPRTTSGLDAPGQVSSPYDLALAGSAALQVPQLEKIMTTKAYPFPMAGRGFGPARKRYSIQTHNKLIWNTPGATGVKNGYTIAARGSFVGSATRGGHTYLAVVLRAEGSTWHATDDLLEWAFRYGARAQPVGELVRPGELPADPGQGVEATAAEPTPPLAAARDASPAASSPGAGATFELAGQLRREIGAVAAVAALALLVAVLRLRRRSRASRRRPSSLGAPSGYGWDEPRRPPPPYPGRNGHIGGSAAGYRPAVDLAAAARREPSVVPPPPPGAGPARHRR